MHKECESGRSGVGVGVGGGGGGGVMGTRPADVEISAAEW